MNKLEDVFQEVSKFTNGEKVDNRMTQLWDLFLETEEPSPERVVEVIEANEESLLERPWSDIVRNKRVLPKFTKALRESTDKEWEDFKKEYEIKPLGKADRERVVLDSSGLVRNTGLINIIFPPFTYCSSYPEHSKQETAPHLRFIRQLTGFSIRRYSNNTYDLGVISRILKK